jgi:Trypsin-co-occurring domain 2
MPDNDPNGIELVEFVNALREEIRSARKDSDPQLPIEVGPVTIELSVLTRREGGGNLGLRFWVVDAGVDGKHAHESTQKITIQLTPLEPGGKRRAQVNDEE